MPDCHCHRHCQRRRHADINNRQTHTLLLHPLLPPTLCSSHLQLHSDINILTFHPSSSCTKMPGGGEEGSSTWMCSNLCSAQRCCRTTRECVGVCVLLWLACMRLCASLLSVLVPPVSPRLSEMRVSHWSREWRRRKHLPLSVRPNQPEL